MKYICFFRLEIKSDSILDEGIFCLGVKGTFVLDFFFGLDTLRFFHNVELVFFGGFNTIDSIFKIIFDIINYCFEIVGCYTYFFEKFSIIKKTIFYK